MARSSRPVTVTLGELQAVVDTRVRSGRYASASEVLRAGLRALDREEAALDEWMRRKVEQSLADPCADVPIDDAFARARAHIAKRNAS